MTPQLSQRISAVQAALSHFQRIAPKPAALSDLDLDDEDDFFTLMRAVEQQALHHCKEIELIDFGPAAATVAYTTEFRLVFRVKTPCYTGYTDRDEDGAYADTEMQTHTVAVFVKPGSTLSTIALIVATEVSSIENNARA